MEIIPAADHTPQDFLKDILQILKYVLKWKFDLKIN